METLLGLLLIYFVPALVARKCNHPHLHSIVVVNVFLGWTVIGWVVALAWAVMPAKVQ
jgi:hypothetical protein